MLDGALKAEVEAEEEGAAQVVAGAEDPVELLMAEVPINPNHTMHMQHQEALVSETLVLSGMEVEGRGVPLYLPIAAVAEAVAVEAAAAGWDVVGAEEATIHSRLVVIVVKVEEEGLMEGYLREGKKEVLPGEQPICNLFQISKIKQIVL